MTTPEGKSKIAVRPFLVLTSLVAVRDAVRRGAGVARLAHSRFFDEVLSANRFPVELTTLLDDGPVAGYAGLAAMRWIEPCMLHFSVLLVSDAFALTQAERDLIAKRLAAKKACKGRADDARLLSQAGSPDLPRPPSTSCSAIILGRSCRSRSTSPFLVCGLPHFNDRKAKGLSRNSSSIAH